MPVEAPKEVRSIPDAVIATLRKCDVPETPANCTICYQYHAGRSPNFQRTIDVIISSNATFDENMLADLYEIFFSTAEDGWSQRIRACEADRSHRRQHG